MFWKGMMAALRPEAASPAHGSWRYLGSRTNFELEDLAIAGHQPHTTPPRLLTHTRNDTKLDVVLDINDNKIYVVLQSNDMRLFNQDGMSFENK